MGWTELQRWWTASACDCDSVSEHARGMLKLKESAACSGGGSAAAVKWIGFEGGHLVNLLGETTVGTAG